MTLLAQDHTAIEIISTRADVSGWLLTFVGCSALSTLHLSILEAFLQAACFGGLREVH